MVKKIPKKSKEEFAFLNPLAESLKEAEEKLEEAYKKEDYEDFSKAKKMLIELQKKVLETVRS